MAVRISLAYLAVLILSTVKSKSYSRNGRIESNVGTALLFMVGRSCRCAFAWYIFMHAFYLQTLKQTCNNAHINSHSNLPRTYPAGFVLYRSSSSACGSPGRQSSPTGSADKIDSKLPFIFIFKSPVLNLVFFKCLNYALNSAITLILANSESLCCRPIASACLNQILGSYYFYDDLYLMFL